MSADVGVGGGRSDLEELCDRLRKVTGVSVLRVDAAACGAMGCRRSDPLWRVDINGGRVRTLCPPHAAEFVFGEVE